MSNKEKYKELRDFLKDKIIEDDVLYNAFRVYLDKYELDIEFILYEDDAYLQDIKWFNSFLNDLKRDERRIN